MGNCVNENKEILRKIQQCLASDYIARHLYQNPDYDDKLNRYEFDVYSQSGEDGIIKEIFRRIGTENEFFIEIGAGDGDVSNTAYLLTQGWSGLWVEMSKTNFKRITDMYKCVVGHALAVKHVEVTAENAERLLADADAPTDLDLLSIDIDGNDYWVWKAIENYRPRVVVIEYNALYPPSVRWAMRYSPGQKHDNSKYHGASLKALVELGLEKGYQLVGCNFAGVNAFFVREETKGFFASYDACYFYEPQRKWLINEVHGRQDFADFFERGTHA